MYNDYALIKKSTLTDIGDAIRAQKGTSGLIDPADFGSEIESIEGGGLIIEGHAEVDSIITDGNSYINTNINPNPNYTIEMEFKISQIVENNWDFLFGCKYGDKSGIAARFDIGESGTLAIKRSQTYLSNREWGIVNFTKKDFSDYRVFKIAKNKAYIDDSLVYTFTATTEANEQHYAYPLYLFTVNDSDTTYLNNSGYLDVKYVKLWDEKDNLILDLIPVVKNDGTVCMYNKVNGAYYYNAGAGTFTYTE